MNCAFDKEKLTGYYDGELDAAEKAEVERHIASCSECLRELGELKSAAVLVKELPRLRAPRSIAEGVTREIQAAGKVHSFAKFRRTLLWVASAAAALLVVMNVVYFSGQTRSPETAAAPKTPAPAMGRAMPAEPLKQDGAAKDAAPERSAAPEAKRMERGRAAGEKRKDTFGGPEGKTLDEAPAARKAAEPKAPTDAPVADRDKLQAGNKAEKAVEEKAKTPAPGAAEPAKPAPPPAPKPEAPVPPPAVAKSEPKPAAADPAAADKAPLKKETDGLAGGKAAEETKARKAEIEATPSHLTLATTQGAKSRTQLEESLRRMGALPPLSPVPAMKGPTRAAREETVWQVELTDAQIARLRSELEKPGTALLVAGRPEDPVMAQFRRGGVFEGKKESTTGVASGGAAAPKKGVDSKQPETKGDSKETDDNAHAAKALASEAPAEKGGEPRRKITLHLMEVPTLQTQPAGDPVKK